MTQNNFDANLSDDIHNTQESTMSEIEQSRLAELEQVVETGLQTFYEVGMALVEIRDTRLYRREFSTFEQYCRERWGFSKRHANRLISSAGVINDLGPSGPEVLPTSESYTRPLQQLDNVEDRRDAWQRAVETAPDNDPSKITHGHVQRVVDDMRGIERQAPEPRQSFSIPDEITKPTTFNNGNYKVTVTPNNYEPPQRESKTYHANNRTDSEQWHSKLMWNYERLDWLQFEHFTIGYSKRTQEQLIEILQVASVRTLVDVRANAYSQYKPDFNRQALSDACSDVGIRYIHMADLGIQSEHRSDLADNHDYDELFDTYEDSTDIIDLLKTRIDLDNDRIACLCVELDPQTCHRSRIAAALEESYQVFDL